MRLVARTHSGDVLNGAHVSNAAALDEPPVRPSRADCSLCLLPGTDPLLMQARRLVAGKRAAARQSALADLLDGTPYTPEQMRHHLRYHRRRTPRGRTRRDALKFKARRLADALAPRDWDILRLTARLGPVTVAQVAVLYFDGHKEGGPKGSRQTAAGVRLRWLAEPDHELLTKYELPHRPGTGDPHVAFALGRVGAEVLELARDEEQSDYTIRAAPFNDDEDAPALRGPSWRHNLGVNDTLVHLAVDAREHPLRTVPTRSGERAARLTVRPENLWAAWHLTLYHCAPTWAEGAVAYPSCMTSVFPDGLVTLGCEVEDGPAFAAPLFLEYDTGKGKRGTGRSAQQAWEYLALAYSGAPTQRLPELALPPVRVGERLVPLWVPVLWVTGRDCADSVARAERLAARVRQLVESRTFPAEHRVLGTPPIYITSYDELLRDGWLAPVRLLHRDGAPVRPLLHAHVAESTVLRLTQALSPDHVLRLDRRGVAPNEGSVRQAGAALPRPAGAQAGGAR